MGQKIHPLGLRLGITQEHASTWITRETFTRWRWLMQDKAIRDFLNTNYKEALLEKIIIRRDQAALDERTLDPTNIVRVWIYAGNPEAMLKFGKSHSLKVISEKLRLVCNNTKLIDSWAKTPQYKILPRIYQIDGGAHKASGIARALIEKLEDRTPFRRALKRTLFELQTSEPRKFKSKRRFKKKKKRRSKVERYRHREQKRRRRKAFRVHAIEVNRLKRLGVIPKWKKQLNASQVKTLKNRLKAEKVRVTKRAAAHKKAFQKKDWSGNSLKVQNQKLNSTATLKNKPKLSTKENPNQRKQKSVQVLKPQQKIKVKPDVKNNSKSNSKFLADSPVNTNIKNALKLSLKGLALKQTRNPRLKIKGKSAKKPNLNQIFKVKGTISEVKQFLELKKQELKKDSIKPIIKKRLKRLTPIKLKRKVKRNGKTAVKPGLKLGLTATIRTPLKSGLKTVVKAPIEVSFKANRSAAGKPVLKSEASKNFIKIPEKANRNPQIKTPATHKLKLNSVLGNSNNGLKPKMSMKPKKVKSELLNLTSTLKPKKPIKFVKPAKLPLPPTKFKNVTEPLAPIKSSQSLKLVNPISPIRPVKLVNPLKSIKLAKRANANLVLKPLLHSKLKTLSKDQNSRNLGINNQVQNQFKTVLKLHSVTKPKGSEDLSITKRFSVSKGIKPLPKAIKISSTYLTQSETKVLNTAILKKEMFKTKVLNKIKKKALRTKAITQNTSNTFKTALKKKLVKKKNLKIKSVKRKTLKTKSIKKKALKIKAFKEKTKQTKVKTATAFKKKTLKLKALKKKNLKLKALKKKKIKTKTFKKKNLKTTALKTKSLKKKNLKKKTLKTKAVKNKVKQKKKPQKQKSALNLNKGKRNETLNKRKRNQKTSDRNTRKARRSAAPFTERYLCRFKKNGLKRKRPISREERNNRRQKRQKQAAKKQRQRELSVLEGVRIQLSGRLNGADIARIEWYKQGRVPLQTLRAQIDYVSKAAKTTHGMLGVKVWTFTGEKGSAF